MKSLREEVVRASFYVSPSIEEQMLLAKSACYLLVSVGQPYHEGKKLEATINLINKKFESCTILVADTLQRYNKEDFSCGNYQIADKQSLYEGDAWLSRNYPIYKNLDIQHKISRWNDWIDSASYSQFKLKFENMYEANQELKNAVDSSVDEFISRLKKRIGERDDQYFDTRRAHCLSYLREECIAMFLWAQAGLGYEIYPTKRNAAMTATYELLIKPSYPLQLKQLALRFKRYKCPDNTEKAEIFYHEEERVY